MEIFAKLARAVRQRLTPPELVVSVEEEGFTVTWGSSSTQWILWSYVREIVAFKRDVVAHDQVCVVFLGEDNAVQVSVTEDHRGFKTLMVETQRRFPSIPEDWSDMVLFPLETRNETVLFQRGQPQRSAESASDDEGREGRGTQW